MVAVCLLAVTTAPLAWDTDRMSLAAQIRGPRAVAGLKALLPVLTASAGGLLLAKNEAIMCERNELNPHNSPITVATLTAENLMQETTDPFNPKGKRTRVDSASILLWHTYDHYGQMVEYLRMNNLVPPASR